MIDVSNLEHFQCPLTTVQSIQPSKKEKALRKFSIRTRDVRKMRITFADDAPIVTEIYKYIDSFTDLAQVTAVRKFCASASFLSPLPSHTLVP